MQYFAEEIMPVLHKEYGHPGYRHPVLTPPQAPTPRL